MGTTNFQHKTIHSNVSVLLVISVSVLELVTWLLYTLHYMRIKIFYKLKCFATYKSHLGTWLCSPTSEWLHPYTGVLHWVESAPHRYVIGAAPLVHTYCCSHSTASRSTILHSLQNSYIHVESYYVYVCRQFYIIIIPSLSTTFDSYDFIVF